MVFKKKDSKVESLSKLFWTYHSKLSKVRIFISKGRFYHEYPVKDVVIDETRNVLYTLSENNSIDVYDLGSNGENTSKVCSYSNLGNEVIKSKNLVEVR